MARQVREKEQTPLWLLSYADMATLVLCFMVLLTSLSVIDERLKLDVLGSVNKKYASSLAIPLPDNPDAFELAKLQEGLGEKRIYGRDFNLLKQQVVLEELGDMTFQENSHVQIVSLNETALFEPGTTALSEKGQTLLDRIMPLLVEIQYPLLVAGHASSRMDEEGAVYNIADDAEDPSWKIGFERAYAVYDYIVEAGVPSDQIRLESFGEYRPWGNMRTPSGRGSNRRVDLVLDKRNVKVAESIKKTRNVEKQEENTLEIDGFQFDLTLPGEEAETNPSGENTSQTDPCFPFFPFFKDASFLDGLGQGVLTGALRQKSLWHVTLAYGASGYNALGAMASDPGAGGRSMAVGHAQGYDPLGQTLCRLEALRGGRHA